MSHGRWAQSVALILIVLVMTAFVAACGDDEATPTSTDAVNSVSNRNGYADSDPRPANAHARTNGDAHPDPNSNAHRNPNRRPVQSGYLSAGTTGMTATRTRGRAQVRYHPGAQEHG